MAVLVNFKICDNAKECGGLEVCPTGAIAWSDEKESLVIDNDKCISCGLCEKNCPIGAFSVAKTEEEYNRIKKEIDDDPRTTKDLFVDRYGAAGISEFFQIEAEEIEEKVKKDCYTLIELYNLDEAECLLKSIPIKELTEDFPKDTLFYKVDCDDNTMKKYNVKSTPAILIFNNKELLGKVEGYYTTDEKDELKDKINNIIKNTDK